MKVNDLRKPLFLLLGLVFLFFGALDPVCAGTIDPALEHALQSLGSQDEVPVIIKVVGKAQLDVVRDRDKGVRRSRIIKALRSKADLSHRDIKAFSTMRGVKKMRSLWIINGMALSATGDVIRELATLPQVESITLDAVVHAPVTTSGTPAAPEWNISAIQAPDLWNLGYTGEGVVVASMDTGVDADHPDLQSRWRGGTNSWFDPNGQHASPADVNGHGTQTMGIIVGGDAGGPSIGVAPGAQWIAVKIFNDAGTATYSAIHQGFQWLLDPDNNPDTNDAPDVVNNSWGLLDPNHSCITEFQPDVQTLKEAGIAVTFSAGNDGPGSATSLSPANYPESFSVGAVDYTNTIMGASSRGPSACGGGIFPYVVAPGADILTTDLHFGIPGAYTTVSGTSFAAPHQSGVMALLISAFPALDLSVLEAALANSCTDLGFPGPDNDYGLGLINSLTAYNVLLDIALPAAPVMSATGIPGSPVNLFWTDGSPVATSQGNPADEIGFRIERATGPAGDFAAIGTTAENVTRFTDTTTTAGRTYRYRVVAFNAVGEATSNSVKVAPPVTPPAAPSCQVATLLARPVRVKLTSRDNATNETGFVIERSTNGGLFVVLATPGPFFGTGAMTYVDGTVQSGNTYAYRMKAVNRTVSSAYSNTIRVKVPTLPAVPSRLAGRASRIFGNTMRDRARLIWRDKSDNETGFQIQRDLTADFAGPTTFTVGANVTTFNQNISRSLNYYYRVRATNAVGASGWSNVVFVTTPWIRNCCLTGRENPSTSSYEEKR